MAGKGGLSRHPMVFEVESLLDDRQTETGPEYLVKWAGFPRSDASWEPLANINTEGVLEEYWRRRTINSQKR